MRKSVTQIITAVILIVPFPLHAVSSSLSDSQILPPLLEEPTLIWVSLLSSLSSPLPLPNLSKTYFYQVDHSINDFLTAFLRFCAISYSSWWDEKWDQRKPSFIFFMLFRLDFHAYLRSLRQSSFFLSFYKFLRCGSELSVAFNSDRVLGSSLWQWISFYVANNNVFGVILIRNLYFSVVYLYLKMIFLLPSKIKEANENLWDFGSLNFLCTDVCSSIIKILM